MIDRSEGSPVERYLVLGLSLGRHVEGLVDAYYGPPELADRVAAAPLRPPAALVEDGRRLMADVADGVPLDEGEGGDQAQRRRWLLAQLQGLVTTAAKLAGEPIGYVDEVERCYGVRPTLVSEDEVAEAHRRLDQVLPGSGPLRDRLVAWRESHQVPPDRLLAAIGSLADELRERTARSIGLPDGEHVRFELVSDRPWAGFNWYHGDRRSTVSVNTDLPVLSLSLAHLVAHESYPGHHTEHTRKEVGLVRRRRWLEETIFLVGTPQCLVAEGLADLGLEVLVGPDTHTFAAAHLRPLGIRYDAEVAAAVADASEVLGAVRAVAAHRLHAEGADPELVADELGRWALLPAPRAAKAVEFLVHPTWRAYVTCYVDGLRLCRRFVGGDLGRFTRLVSEQLVPADLHAA